MDIEAEVAEAAHDAASGNTAGLKEKWHRGSDAAKRYAGQAGEKAKEYASKAKDMTEKRIHENPFYAMLISMGVGMAVGMLVGAAAWSSRNKYEC